MTGIWKKVLLTLAFVAAWLLIWEMAFRLSGKASEDFGSPISVLRALGEGLSDYSFTRGLLASLARVSYGFGVALLLGALIGFGLASSRFCEWLLGPLVLGVQCLPSICWLPVAILWFGLNERAILFVVIMGSVGSITLAMRDGLRQAPVTYLRVAGTYGASRLQRLFWVSLPAALPGFVSGLKQGWSFAWRSLLAGELLFRMVGVGGLLTESRDLADYPRMFAVMLLIVGVSILIDRVLFGNLERRLRARWGLEG